MTRRGWLLFAAMSVIWGIPYLLIKVAVRDLDPAVLVCARTGIGASVLVPLAAWRRQLRPVIGCWRAVLAYTAVELAVPWVLLSNAERRLPSSLSGLLVAAVPLVTATVTALAASPLGRSRTQDRVGMAGFAGVAVGLVGVVVLLGLDVRTGDTSAVAEVGVVVVGYALGPMIAARHLGHLPRLGVVAVSLAACALAYLPAAVVEAPARVPGRSVVAATVVLGVVCTALAFVLFFALIAEAGPARATLITYVNPAVAVILGVGFLGEGFGLGTAAGFALILAGCWIATRRPRAVAPS